MNETNIQVPSLKGLKEYLHFQYPSTAGDILLNKLCDELASLPSETKGMRSAEEIIEQWEKENPFKGNDKDVKQELINRIKDIQQNALASRDSEVWVVADELAKALDHVCNADKHSCEMSRQALTKFNQLKQKKGGVR